MTFLLPNQQGAIQRWTHQLEERVFDKVILYSTQSQYNEGGDRGV